MDKEIAAYMVHAGPRPDLHTVDLDLLRYGSLDTEQIEEHEKRAGASVG